MPRFCSNCGKQLKENYKFCTNCGSAVFELAKQNVSSFIKYTNDLGTAGFIVSIISFLSFGTFSLLGLILSIIGLVNANKNNGEGKGLSIAGIVISSVALFCLLLLIFVLYCSFLAVKSI